MTVTLNLKPEVEAWLLAHTRSAGVTPEEYLQQLVEKNLALGSTGSGFGEESGMVWEDGLLVYRTGTPLPAHVIDKAIDRLREERSRQILGDHS